MAKLIKTIKQYEGVCTQCGDSFVTYKPEEEKLCYRCQETKNYEIHNKEMSELHRFLLNKKVMISNLSLRSCRNRNFVNFIQLVDEEDNVINIGVTQESDHDEDATVFDIDIRSLSESEKRKKIADDTMVNRSTKCCQKNLK